MKYLIIILLLLAACTKFEDIQPTWGPATVEVDRPINMFTISKGAHYSMPRMVQTTKKLDFEVYIDDR